MSDFIKCPQGHLYDSKSKECPYCNGAELDEDLENLPENPTVDKDILKNIANCYLVGPKED